MSIEVTTKKYVDPGNPVVIVITNKFPIESTLIDLGETINVMTLKTLIQLVLHNILPPPTMFQLFDRSKLKTEGILEDVIVSLDSCEYPKYLYVIQPTSNLGGNPLIIGRTWINTTDVFIGCRSRNIKITNVTKIKQITVYPC